MSGDSPGLLLLVVALVVLAAALTTIEAALSSFSRARALELAHEQRPGRGRAAAPARRRRPTTSTRCWCCGCSPRPPRWCWPPRWCSTCSAPTSGPRCSSAIGVMFLVLFVLVGVGPRTLGRQHSESISLATAGAVLGLGRVLGPLPRLLILIGNALTPGKGFSEGPFSSEAELREMVDLAEASSLIESGESKMIHSVFELGDTSVREVMVPRTDVVYIERTKTLRQAMSLFLRSGFSRIPVVGEDLDDIIGFAYLKDVSKRVFDRQAAQTTEHVESMMRPVFHVPDSKPVDDLLREMQARASTHRRRGRRVRRHRRHRHDRGHPRGDRRRDHRRVRHRGGPVEELPDGSMRVSARFPVDDLDEILGVAIEDDEVDSVGGLMAKHLGKVPDPGLHGRGRRAGGSWPRRPRAAATGSARC